MEDFSLQETFEFKLTRANGEETILKQTFDEADIFKVGELFRSFLEAVTYSDCTIDLIMTSEEAINEFDYSTWTGSDGKTLLISNMSNSHIENCIRMINRSQKCNEDDLEGIATKISSLRIVNYELHKPYLNVLIKELRKRSQQ